MYVCSTPIQIQRRVTLRSLFLAGINFSDFAITCSINLKMCDKF